MGIQSEQILNQVNETPHLKCNLSGMEELPMFYVAWVRAGTPPILSIDTSMGYKNFVEVRVRVILYKIINNKLIKL